MKSRKPFLFFVLILAIVTSAGAQSMTRDEAREAEVVARLEKISPKSVETFKSATVALDDDDLEQAEKLYGEVLKDAPDFDPAMRRRGGALVRLGKRDEGLALSKKALALNRDTANLLSYANSLTETEAIGREPTASELKEALSLAKEAMNRDKSKDPDAMISVAQYSLSSGDKDTFDNVVSRLTTEHPDLGAGHYYNGIRLANDGDFTGGIAEINKAEQLGVPKQAADSIRKAIDESRSSQFFGLYDYIWYGFYVIGAWAVGLAVLFISGKILSKKTVSSLDASDPNDIAGESHTGLRSVYRRLISVAGFYYYISQPVVILLVIFATAAVILGFVAIGTIPIKLVAVLGIVGAASVFYMLKSLLFRPKIEDSGRVLTEAEAPQLWAIVREVAKTVNTRPVNEIRLTPAAEMAVYERGSMREKMNDKAERILIVGLAGLDGFSLNAFRAVLAHEYGHFSNRDTAGGDIAFRVNNDIIQAARSMAEGGTATFYNLAFQFLRLYHFLFRRITHGASRLQEVLADRVAVYHYGAEAFREGLTHIIRRDIEFGRIVNTEFSAAFGSGRKMNNLYELLAKSEGITPDLETEFNEVINRPTTEDDTHPSPVDRFRLADMIRPKTLEPVSGQVWDLLRDREALTTEINSMLEQQLNQMAYESV